MEAAQALKSALRGLDTPQMAYRFGSPVSRSLRCLRPECSLSQREARVVLRTPAFTLEVGGWYPLSAPPPPFHHASGHDYHPSWSRTPALSASGRCLMSAPGTKLHPGGSLVITPQSLVESALSA
jgi:hypothetical protein